MSYGIYQTKGIILEKRNFGEADKMLTIYTEQFGKIIAVAQGSRHLKSKLRYNLEPFSFSNFSFVSTRSGWRIVDADEIISSKEIMASNFDLALFVRLAYFLNRMISGEEKNDFIWSEIKNLFLVLKEGKIAKNKTADLEIDFTLKILNNLGYLEKKQYASKSVAVSAINNAIKESML